MLKKIVNRIMFVEQLGGVQVHPYCLCLHFLESESNSLSTIFSCSLNSFSTYLFTIYVFAYVFGNTQSLNMLYLFLNNYCIRQKRKLLNRFVYIARLLTYLFHLQITSILSNKCAFFNNQRWQAYLLECFLSLVWRTDCFNVQTASTWLNYDLTY